MRYVSTAGRAAVMLMILLSACGGGSGGGNAAVSVTSVSTHTLAFSAASPDDPTPAAQTFTATISPGTLYFAVIPNGSAIATASFTLSGSTATVTVSPAAPSALGAGTFTGIVTVSGQSCADAQCTSLISGQRQDVNVTFQIPPTVRFVAPYVGQTNTAGTVLIRGQGFQKFPVEGVSFGATAASAFAVLSDTEIQASYPALATGSYAVQVQASTSPGAIVSSATLAVIDPTAYAAAAVSYPAPVTQVKRLVYDAERQALLLAVDSSGGEILRYAYTGGAWATPMVAPIGSLEDIALSTAGTQLLALSQTDVTPIDPASLAAGSVIAGPSLVAGSFLKNLAVTNTDTAIVTTGFSGSTTSLVYLYGVRSTAFTQPVTAIALDNATPTASADGSLVAIAQGDTSLTTAPSTYQYLSATNAFSATVAINQNAVAPALDRNAARIVLNGINVYDPSYNLLGTLPSTTLAVVVKPDATRAYIWDSAAAAVLSFDLTATASGAALPQVGTATVLSADPGSGVQMAISPDGGTLFLAGSNQIVVQPAPP